jgi:glucose/mannose transport system substrate-binding protein
MATIKLFVSAITLILLSTAVLASDVEVLHYMTSTGEAAAIDVLKEELRVSGHSWKEVAVAGGGGETAMTVLKFRALSGKPPAAAQIKGPQIQEWGEQGLLTSLDSIASAGHWDELLPPVVSNMMKYQGEYVAVPVNVHRVNWLWANPDVFRKAGVAIPTTWDQFFEVANVLKSKGILPLAYGGQTWQDATFFETVALGVGGAEFYSSAFVDLNQKTLTSATMVKVFETFRKTREYTDADAPGRDWHLATRMVSNGEAAMQIMGDWAKGEFTAAGQHADVDYVCLAAPDTSGAFIFNIDSFAMFELRDSDAREAQADLARLVMEPMFQQAFNVNKGSIPARLGMDRAVFDSCAHASMDAFVASAATAQLVPSMAHGMATSSQVQSAIYDVVTAFYNSKNLSAKEAVDKLAHAIDAAR